MPASDIALYDGYFNVSPECWSVFTEVIAKDYSDAEVFGQVHQLTVDAYAVQHAGGPHPDKSVDVHLSGLYLVLVRGFRPPDVAPQLKRLIAEVEAWPHFPPPAERGSMTVWDVALADSREEHFEKVREWSGQAWEAWSAHHDGVEAFVARHLWPRERS